MPRLIGWQKETTEGTSLIAAATAITEFGFVGDYDWSIPFPKRKPTLTFQENVRGQKGVTLGAKEVAFTVPYSLKNAYPFVRALGAVDTSAGVSTITMCAPEDLPSYSIYAQVRNNAYIARGCKVKQLSVMIEVGKPIKIEEDFVGWDVDDATAMTADPPVIPPATSDTSLKGWGNVQSGTLEHGGDAQTAIKSIQLVINNSLDPQVGIASPIPTGIDVGEEGAVMLNYTGTFLGSADELFEKFRDGLTEDMEIELDLGSGNYYNILAKAVVLDAPVVTVKKAKSTEYALSGWTTGTNITVAIKDGHDYETL